MTDREDHPTKIGPYRIEGRLGAGGMGTVYRAYHERLHRGVALKQIRPERARNPQARERLLREARAAAKLNHPAIVQVYDIVEAEGEDWIVMELVDGNPLSHLLKSGPWHFRRALPLALEIASGLSSAHANGIVHRDLKIENVVVTADGHAKILDFGLAKQFGDPDVEDSLTSAGQMVGTPRTMSPEQARAEKVDHRSDLFSLGTLLYEMLTGVSPFRSEALPVTLKKICDHRQTSARELVPELPQLLSDLIDRLLEKEPSHRPQNALEVISVLENLAGSLTTEETTLAGPIPTDGQGRKAQTGERRQVTMMCCDLLPASESSPPLDPELLYEVMSSFQAHAGEAIQRYEGHPGPVSGRRWLVYFGYPLAHEDDAWRAVHAAQELVEVVNRHEEEWLRMTSHRWTVRIGIHTGPALVIVEPSAQQRLAVGETIDQAAAIQHLAPPNGVVMSAATYRLVEGLATVEEVPARRLPGSDPSIRAYKLVSFESIHRRMRSAALLTPLVARERELGVLLSSWRSVKEGVGQVVSLSGEAGIGKSRLVGALKEQLDEEAPIWLVAQGSPHARNSPLQPVIELLRGLFELDVDVAPAQQLTRLEQGLRRLDFPLNPAVPLLASLFSLPLSERYLSLDLSPDRQKRETLEVVSALLLESAERTPVVLVMEDLHWIDPSTLELLSLLIDRAPGISLFLLLTFRLVFDPPWRHPSHLTQLELSRLTAREVEMVIDRVSSGHILPAAVREQIVTKSDGVPLFIEELTRTVLESEPVSGDEPDQPIPALAVPATLRDSLTARLDRMGTAKPVAQLAAALGREFSFDLLRSVSPLGEAALERELDRLVEARLMYRKGFPSRRRYLFKHALIQDAAYESLLKRRRQGIHAEIAVVLETRFPETAATQPELLAHHYTEARQPEPALRHWQRAATRAFERSAIVEATAHLKRGKALLDDLPPGAERDASELALMTALGAALSATIGAAAPEVHEAYQRALELCQARDDAPELFWVLWGLSRFHYARSNHKEGLELGHRLVRLAADQEETAPQYLVRQVAAHWSLVQALFMVGEFASAYDLVEKGIGFDNPDRNRPIASQTEGDPGVVLLGWSARCLWFLGYPERALARMDQALSFADRISHPLSLTYSLNFGIHFCYYRRDRASLLEQGRKELILSRQQGSWMELSARICLGWAVAVDADADEVKGQEALKDIQSGIDRWAAIGARTHLPQFLLMLAEARGRLGRVDDGQRSLGEALTEMQTTGERFLEAEAYRLQGELALMGKAKDEADRKSQKRQAESSFQRALDIARGQNAKSLELRAATSLSRLWAGEDRRSEARKLLEDVYGWFTEGFDTRDLQEARDLLAGLS